jgi:hypothetical protein
VAIHELPLHPDIIRMFYVINHVKKLSKDKRWLSVVEASGSSKQPNCSPIEALLRSGNS